MEWGAVVGGVALALSAIVLVRDWPTVRGPWAEAKRVAEVLSLLPPDARSRPLLLNHADRLVNAALATPVPGAPLPTWSLVGMGMTAAIGAYLLATVGSDAWLIVGLVFAGASNVWAIANFVVTLRRARERKEPPVRGQSGSPSAGA